MTARDYGPKKPRLRGVIKILALVALVIFGNLLAEWIMDLMDFELRVRTEPMIHRVVMMSAAAYVVLMALPFVPGVEIGMALLFMFGPKAVPLVYLCTVTALTISFLVGRLIPERMLTKFVGDIGLRRSAALLEQFQALDADQRLQSFLARAPKRFIPFLLRYRYIALVLVINLPGNIAVGGGGGIALMAGLSRLFAPKWFLVSVAAAVAPVPLFLILFGEHLGPWPL